MSDDTKHDPARPDRIPVEELRDWETIQSDDVDDTQRLKIAGGWLYRSIGKQGVALVFVPDRG